MRDRVRDAIAELGYRPSSTARSLSLGRSQAIGVVAPFFTTPSVVERLRGVSQRAGHHGYGLMLFDVETPEQRAGAFRDFARLDRVDGLLVISLPLLDDEVDALERDGLPVVMIDIGHPRVPHVVIDDVRGGELAVEHLIARGHRRIGFVGDRPDNPFGFTSSEHRRRGFRRALRRARPRPGPGPPGGGAPPPAPGRPPPPPPAAAGRPAAGAGPRGARPPRPRRGARPRARRAAARRPADRDLRRVRHPGGRRARGSAGARPARAPRRRRDRLRRHRGRRAARPHDRPPAAARERRTRRGPAAGRDRGRGAPGRGARRAHRGRAAHDLSVPSYSAAMAAPEPWWKTAVVYQIYPRSFADSDGDGIGDLRGIAARLDYVAALGVDVIWLSPVYPSPQDDAGYDISDYEDIDPTFGTLADFDALLGAIHERGMKLVMDLVVNHTSDEHPWFVASRSSREDPKRAWYWWRPPRAGMEPGAPGAEPTNWGSAFSGPAWELDPRSGEYYLHLFSRKQPDLNWESPAVREAVYAMMRRWLDRGVDGFRMDVINLISKDPALADGTVVAGGAYAPALPHVNCGPRIHEFLQEMHREVFARREDRLLTVGEMPGVTIDEAKLFTDPARHEVDMVFQFEHVDLDHGATKWDVHPLRLTDLKASFGRWQAGLAERGWNSLYWNNHDQPRVVSRFGDDGAMRVRSAK